ncbi:MAG: site-specific DNA-methyltransferase, partial [Segetibacter sp.]
MNKSDLIQKLKQLEGLTNEERSELINLVNTTKKYGLVWEDKPEQVEEELRENLPVLREVVNKRIIGKPLPKKVDDTNTLFNGLENFRKPDNLSLESYPNHILIEGDNLHALTALTFTHEGKIDMIYIDPPYNTGNNDFKYNDHYVDKEDSYRHSKWLSFMNKRLKIAKQLLDENGVIFISIDDNEQAQLKMLCDKVFSEENFVDNIIWEKNYAPRNDAKYFSAAHDFIVVYRKGEWERKLEERSEKSNLMYKYDDKNGRGVYRTGDVLVKSFNEAGVFPVVNPNTGKEHLPAKGSCWRYSKETFYRMIEENRIYWGKDGKGSPQTKRYLNEVKQGTVPQTIWKYQDVGHTQDGKNELKDLALTSRAFETPKPSSLIKKIISYDTRNNAIILDFFAGSGTTLHATMKLNAEDGGKRQCILVTNNENNICEEVTYERNKRVIQGYTNTKSQQVPGLSNNNLRYYKTEFVPAEKTQINRRLLTASCTELLQIKEDCYTPVDISGLKSSHGKVFTNGTGKYLAVIYYSRQQHEAIYVVTQWIVTVQDASEKIKLYAFSPEAETLAADFAEVSDNIDAVPLPDAIYNAYRNTFRTLKLDRRKDRAVTEASSDAPVA